MFGQNNPKTRFKNRCSLHLTEFKNRQIHGYLTCDLKIRVGGSVNNIIMMIRI